MNMRVLTDVTAAPPHLELLQDLIGRARAAGADAADALIASRRSLTIGCRLGRRETLEQADAVDLGLRVFVGRRQALVSSSDLSAPALVDLVARAVTMAHAVPEDPYCGLADNSEIVSQPVDVDGCDPAEPSLDDLSARAEAAESAARAVAGITNSEGAEAAWGMDTWAIAASNGLAQSFRRSWHSLSVSVVAGKAPAMERDYEYAAAVHGTDLPDPATLGRSAGEKAVGRLGPRKAATARVPVVFAPRVARSLLGHLAGAISGQAVARGTSFLRDKLGSRIFAEGVSIVDDPLRRRGLRSQPFDGEGIVGRPLSVIDQGVLTSWLLDLGSARQLGLSTTGRAARGVSSLPSPASTNLYLAPGRVSAEVLMSDIAGGLYVTELIGFGVNAVTGDYSRGASGYWIESGVPAFPVSEVTISGNLIEMFRQLTAANDLEFRYGVDAPTVRIDGMTVAGR
jgi:PmbA protein